MDEFFDIVETFETDDFELVNQRLADGWVLLSVASGQAEDLGPKFLYCLGLPSDGPEL